MSEDSRNFELFQPLTETMDDSIIASFIGSAVNRTRKFDSLESAPGMIDPYAILKLRCISCLINEANLRAHACLLSGNQKNQIFLFSDKRGCIVVFWRELR